MTINKDWLVLEDINIDTSAFPAAAILDDENIVIFKSKAGFHALQRRCPHKRADLSKAGSIIELDDQIVIRCAMHGFQFRACNGKSINFPGLDATVYEIEEEGTQLKVRKAADWSQ